MKAAQNQLEAALSIAEHMEGASVVNVKTAQHQIKAALCIALHVEEASVVSIKDV
eukprot:CAMPEP_0114243136 /NCGR_PEP_ID=MMETSP0058-20121206/10614_1 /TAXON_ID=36894 /ORGANISM="Pyramimonas parkeae, CCMP726" /LENGTH=54 /DNA_ID=CAMNT_0001355927 /DNA_START=548 /DNA_END=712 /DNA_ORIENTATION=-